MRKALPQSGNAAWKAVMKAHEWKKGRPGLRVCTGHLPGGKPCGKLAMRGTHVCQRHGGRQAVLARKLREAKYAKARVEEHQRTRKFKRAGREGVSTSRNEGT